MKHRGKTDQEIRALLARQGIQISVNAIKTRRYRMKKEGLPAGKLFKVALARNLLRANSGLTNKEAIEQLKKFGVKMHDVKHARSQLKQKAPEPTRYKAFPRMTAKRLALIEQSLPILKRLVEIKTLSKGWGFEFAEDAFLELSSELPHWIAKKKPGADLEAFLDFKTKYALKSFKTKIIMQKSGLTQKEVRNGMKWRDEWKAGKDWQAIAKKYKADPAEVREIVFALEDVFRTIPYTRF